MCEEDEKGAPKEVAPAQPEKDVVEEADDESFPASDPPAYTGTHAGEPKR